jgi:hypothetical protein
VKWLNNCFHYGFTPYDREGIPYLPSPPCTPNGHETPFPIRESRFFCVESLKRKKNRNGSENLVSSTGAARLSNNLLHGLNLGLAAAESTELDMKLVKASTQWIDWAALILVEIG